MNKECLASAWKTPHKSWLVRKSAWPAPASKMWDAMDGMENNLWGLLIFIFYQKSREKSCKKEMVKEFIKIWGFFPLFVARW